MPPESMSVARLDLLYRQGARKQVQGGALARIPWNLTSKNFRTPNLEQHSTFNNFSSVFVFFKFSYPETLYFFT